MPREKKPKTMKVAVQVEFWIPFNQTHVDAMKSAAISLSCEEASVEVYPDGECLVASFLMPKALEMETVDRILHHFRVSVPESDNFTIWFPKPRRIRKSRRKIVKPLSET